MVQVLIHFDVRFKVSVTSARTKKDIKFYFSELQSKIIEEIKIRTKELLDQYDRNSLFVMKLNTTYPIVFLLQENSKFFLLCNNSMIFF